MNVRAASAGGAVRAVVTVIAAIVAVGAAACAAPDYPMPEPTREGRNRVRDLGRDLAGLSADGSLDELTDGLASVAHIASPPDAVQALARAVRDCAAAAPGGAAGDRAAADLFRVMNGGYLGRAEVAALEDDVAAALGCAPAARRALHDALWHVARGVPNAGDLYR